MGWSAWLFLRTLYEGLASGRSGEGHARLRFFSTGQNTSGDGALCDFCAASLAVGLRSDASNAPRILQVVADALDEPSEVVVVHGRSGQIRSPVPL